ncbi:MAG: hypothetical protein HYY46_21295 [Deltaproteobacteria bacterium]|nr:hypothetical protein [Deltaproteobacteria bacterium]
MEGNPAHFEALGTRLGFRVDISTDESLRLTWRGARFPAFLCLGIACILLSLSVPIVVAIQQRGLEGPAGSLWYFPVMNLILLGVAFYLLSLKRMIVIDPYARQVRWLKSSIFRRLRLSVDYAEVTALRLGIDEVYSGFAVAGSSDEKYPVPSLRVILASGDSVLIDRGGIKRLNSLGERLSRLLEKPLHIEDTLLN